MNTNKDPYELRMINYTTLGVGPTRVMPLRERSVEELAKMVEAYQNAARIKNTEVHFQNLALKNRNDEIKRLKSELRLLRRLFKMPTHPKLDEALTLLRKRAATRSEIDAFLEK